MLREDIVWEVEEMAPARERVRLQSRSLASRLRCCRVVRLALCRASWVHILLLTGVTLSRPAVYRQRLILPRFCWSCAVVL